MSYDPHQMPPTRQMGAQQPPAYPQHGYGPPVPQQPQQGYAQQPTWVPPTPVKKPWTPGKVIALVFGLVALFCVGVAVLPSSSDKPASSPEKAAALPVTSAARKGAPASLSPPEAAAKVAMPDVKGQNAAVAQDYLEKLGFSNVTFGTQDEQEGFVVLPENWTVKKQSTTAGRKIPTDTLIVLTCTKIN